MSVLRFGAFEANLATAELYSKGRRVHVQQQPFAVLAALLEHPGELVTREVLRSRLWTNGTVVEFDQSLNKSVAKLRDALGDSAAHPRYIETLPKRGYRFIAPVTRRVEPVADESANAPAPVAGAAEPASHPVQAAELRAPRVSARVWAPATILTVAAGLLVLSLASSNSPAPLEAGADRATRAPGVRSPIHAARDAYDRGRLALSRRTPEGLRLGVIHFERAVALSPRYAQAYAGLADGWSLLSSYGVMDPREGMPRARAAANRALALDPSMAHAHASLARTAMIFDWDWPTAAFHFERALTLDPGDATTHQWHAYYLSAIGRHDEAIAEARRAVAAAPLSLNTNTGLGYVLYLARQYDAAEQQLGRTLEIDPDFAQARRNLALVKVQQGHVAEARVLLQRVADASPSTIAAAELAWVRALDGDRAGAREALDDLDQRRGAEYVSPDVLALVSSGLGAREPAVAWLQRAYEMRVPSIAHLPVEPVWDPLRDDERVRRMVAVIARE